MCRLAPSAPDPCPGGLPGRERHPPPPLAAHPDGSPIRGSCRVLRQYRVREASDQTGSGVYSVSTGRRVGGKSCASGSLRGSPDTKSLFGRTQPRTRRSLARLRLRHGQRSADADPRTLDVAGSDPPSRQTSTGRLGGWCRTAPSSPPLRGRSQPAVRSGRVSRRRFEAGEDPVRRPAPDAVPGTDHVGRPPWVARSVCGGPGDVPRPDVFVKRKHIWLPGNPQTAGQRAAIGRSPLRGGDGGCPGSHDRALGAGADGRDQRVVGIAMTYSQGTVSGGVNNRRNGDVQRVPEPSER